MPATTVWSALLLGLAVAGAACREEPSMEELKAEIRERYPQVSQIDVQAFHQARRGDRGGEILLLDARQPQEFAVSHLPGAVLSPDLDGALQALQGRSPAQPVVVYCSVGYRSSALAAQLQDRGFGNVRNLEGSLFEWANVGLPLVREGRSVKEAHPYDRRWGRYLKPELWAFEADGSTESDSKAEERRR